MGETYIREYVDILRGLGSRGLTLGQLAALRVRIEETERYLANYTKRKGTNDPIIVQENN